MDLSMVDEILVGAQILRILEAQELLMEVVVDVRQDAGERDHLGIPRGRDEASTRGMEALRERVIRFNAEGMMVTEGAGDFHAWSCRNAIARIEDGGDRPRLLRHDAPLSEQSE
jgi:hypothetical protein